MVTDLEAQLYMRAESERIAAHVGRENLVMIASSPKERVIFVLNKQTQVSRIGGMVKFVYDVLIELYQTGRLPDGVSGHTELQEVGIDFPMPQGRA